MVKTYVLAPNWTTAPPPDGPIKLGHVLDDLTEFVPLNREEVTEIEPKYLNKTDTKDGFTTSRSKLVSGELGIFARVMGLVGFGAGADMYYRKDMNDILSCKRLDTITFDPTAKYIADTMARDEIQGFMEGCKFNLPVYMITGLKVGRGASLQSSTNIDRGVKLDGGLQAPGSPVEIGGKAGVAVNKGESESWTGSTDFIVAFRARKIWYHHEALKSMTNLDKVVMQDGTPIQKGSNMTLKVDDEISVEDLVVDASLMMHKDVEDGEEVTWIIPNVGAELV
ncbi:hypothetical protein Neosp_010021 [[Neocosmospora] mangrovei]